MLKNEKKNLVDDKKEINYNLRADKIFWLYVFLFFIVMIFGSIVSLRNICLINEKSREIVLMQEKLKIIESDNKILENEISKRFDLSFVEEIAKKKLGMHEPFLWQVIKIKRPEFNYLIRYNKKS